MANDFGIRPTKYESESGYVKPMKIDDTVKVSFNFRRLCSNGKKFIYDNRKSKYFVKLLERLKDLSNLTKRELITQQSSGLRFHKIDFVNHNVSEGGFGIRGEDIDEDAWQFQLSSNEHGRVHGYFVGNIFYVVWLDPEHQLYPNYKK